MQTAAPLAVKAAGEKQNKNVRKERDKKNRK